MVTATLRRNGALTIPSEVRRAAHLDEGDELEFEVIEGGVILRRREIDGDPPYYGTPEWDAKVQEALDAVEAGQVTRYEFDGEFLASFK